MGKEGSVGKIFGWLGGIVATAAAGWLVWYLTLPPAPVTFEGMVYDQTSNAPVSKAMVMFEIKGVPNSGPYRDVTDENGSYKMELSNLEKSATVTVFAEANGFGKSTPYPFPGAGDNRRDFPLTAVHPMFAMSPAIGAATHVSPHAVLARPKYVPKLVATKFKIK